MRSGERVKLKSWAARRLSVLTAKRTELTAKYSTLNRFLLNLRTFRVALSAECASSIRRGRAEGRCLRVLQWMTGWSRHPKGSAGILPASCRHPGAGVRIGDGVGLHSARAQASGRMPKAAGWKPALPFGYTRMGIFGVALFELWRQDAGATAMPLFLWFPFVPKSATLFFLNALRGSAPATVPPNRRSRPCGPRNPRLDRAQSSQRRSISLPDAKNRTR